MSGLAELAEARGWRAEPWRNGRGITYVIARWPDTDEYDVRVSIAEVTESGPFSAFPGRTRWTTLVSDGAIALDERPLVRGEPLALDGDAAPYATFGGGGPVVLLNVVARPGYVEVEVEVGGGSSPEDADFALELGGVGVWVRLSRRHVHR